jgi:hypothetical protein
MHAGIMETAKNTMEFRKGSCQTSTALFLLTASILLACRDMCPVHAPPDDTYAHVSHQNEVLVRDSSRNGTLRDPGPVSAIARSRLKELTISPDQGLRLRHEEAFAVPAIQVAGNAVIMRLRITLTQTPNGAQRVRGAAPRLGNVASSKGSSPVSAGRGGHAQGSNQDDSADADLSQSPVLVVSRQHVRVPPLRGALAAARQLDMPARSGSSEECACFC